MSVADDSQSRNDASWAIRLVPRLSFQGLLVTLFSALVLIATGAVSWINWRLGSEATERQLSQLVDQASGRIEQHLDGYFEKPRLANAVNTVAVTAGLLDTTSTEALILRFWEIAEAFDVGTIGFADAQGRFVGVNKPENYISISNDVTSRTFVRYAPGDNGLPGRETARRESYDARERAWYRNAVEGGTARWSVVSSSVDITLQSARSLDVTAVQPVTMLDGRFVGVFMCDVDISQLNEFLNSLRVGLTGGAFIIDGSGRLVASSFPGEKVVREAAGKLERARAEDSGSPLIRAAAARLGDITTDHGETRFDWNETSYLLHVSRYASLPPLDLIVAVVIPRADLMADVEKYRRTTFYLSASVLVLAIGLGLITARMLSGPLTRLVTAAQSVAEGDLHQSVETDHPEEIASLAKAFNRMTGRLQRSFADLQARNAELHEHKNRLRELTSAALLAESRERRQIATDVHDTTVQSLGLARIRLGQLRSSLRGTDQAALAEDATRFVDDAITQARALVYELNPPALYEVGLAAGLEWLGERLEQRFAIKFRLVSPLGQATIDDDTRTLLFQVARELLNNVAKHANASRVTVTLDARAESVLLAVADDGKGFETGAIAPLTTSTGGFGLFSIRERIEARGGTLDIVTRASQGTEVTVHLPMGGRQESP
jgi:signal transduction histidine kinase